jgi:hypothetical protein
MLTDEVIEEVRAAREAHAAKFNYDLRAIFEDLKKSETKRIAAGHPFVALPTLVSETLLPEQRTRFGHT